MRVGPAEVEEHGLDLKQAASMVASYGQMRGFLAPRSIPRSRISMTPKLRIVSIEARNAAHSTPQSVEPPTSNITPAVTRRPCPQSPRAARQSQVCLLDLVLVHAKHPERRLREQDRVLCILCYSGIG